MKQPKTPPTTKALQALQSELRHLQEKLAQWESDLTEREATLEEQEAAFEAALENADDGTVERYASTWEDAHDPSDCGCSDSDAGGGCDCPKCQNTRANWVGGEDFTKHFNLHPYDDVRGGTRRSASMTNPMQPKGDEVKWLEDLWKLEDKRKKK